MRGIPERLHLDNAREFRSEALKRGCEQYGIAIDYRPVRTPHYGGHIERLIGTMRRECLDWLIPIHEGHLRWILHEWVTHYNRGRPHASLGPGIPDLLSERKQLVSTVT